MCCASGRPHIPHTVLRLRLECSHLDIHVRKKPMREWLVAFSVCIMAPGTREEGEREGGSKRKAGRDGAETLDLRHTTLPTATRTSSSRSRTVPQASTSSAQRAHSHDLPSQTACPRHRIVMSCFTIIAARSDTVLWAYLDVFSAGADIHSFSPLQGDEVGFSDKLIVQAERYRNVTSVGANIIGS